MGILKYSEVSNLRMSDIVIHDSYMAIFVGKSKTDIYRNGSWHYLAKLKSKPSAINLARGCIKLAQIDKHNSGYISRELCKRGKSFPLKEKKTYILVIPLQEKMC